MLVAVVAPLGATVMVPEREPRLQAGVTVPAGRAVPAVLLREQAGVTVMEPAVPEANMQAGVTVPPEPEVNTQAGVTVSVPTVAAENVQIFVHAACSPIWKVVAVGVPHTNAPTEARVAAVVIPVQPVMVRLAVPATNESGAPTVRVPTAAVR